MRLVKHLSMAALVVATVAATATAAPKGGGAAKGNDMEFEPENAASTPPSKTLERAIKLYDKKDFFSASIELKKVLDGESGDDAKNKQRAEFFMGKTLYQMGFYAASLAYFDGYRTASLPQNLTQAQRDAFGAHTYQRNDVAHPPFVHTEWLKD